MSAGRDTAEEELCYTPATKLVELIANKSLSPVELMDAVLARLEKLNPELNAVCTPTIEEARTLAREAESMVMGDKPLGPLHGIPLTIKDTTYTKGVRTMLGSRLKSDFVPSEDAPLVERLQGAGGISIGKTTVPEYAWTVVSNSPQTGISHNPWKRGFNAGGSSSGAAICAAAGMAPLHQGSDGAGSVRVPAHFCGIYGIKPSYGRIPNYPPSNTDSISHIGPMTRTVADSALMLEVMAGPDDRDMTSLDAQPPSYTKLLEGDLKGLRVAFSPDFGYLTVDSEVAQIVKQAVLAFEELGCHVEQVNSTWDDCSDWGPKFWQTMLVGSYRSTVEASAHLMDPGLVACVEEGKSISFADFHEMRVRRVGLYEQMRQFFDKYDLLISPTASVAAFPASQLIPEHWVQHAWNWLTYAGFSYPFNLSGMPAASCPAGFTSEGLPVGLQIAGGRFQDALVLRASRAFEQARPWAQHRPPVGDG